MAIRSTTPPGRLFVLLAFLGLLLAIGATAVFLRQSPSLDRPGLVPLTTASRPHTQPTDKQRAGALLAFVLVVVLAVVVFFVSVYLVVRLGRVLLARNVGGSPTRYVDAWTKYRITQEEIDAATCEPGAGPPPGSSPDDDRSEGTNDEEDGRQPRP